LEVSVLGVAPGALRAVKAAGAGGVFVDAGDVIVTGIREPVTVKSHHQVALAAVVDDRAQLGIEVSGVADLRAEHVEVLVVHHTHGAVVVGQVLQLDLANEDVAVEIDGFVAVEGEAEVAVIEGDAGGQRVPQVTLADLPAGIAGPEQAALVLAGDVAVDAEPAGSSAGVVLLPDVGEKNVADLI